MELRYLYVGTDDTGIDLAHWLALPGARLRWRFRHFGADVAAVDTGAAPVVLIADHRPAGSVLPIFAVPDLDEARDRLVDRGWTVGAGPLGTPEGTAVVLDLPAGSSLALLQVERPDTMDSAYADATNPHRVA